MHSATDLGNSSEDQSSGNFAAHAANLNLTNVKCKQNNNSEQVVSGSSEKVNALASTQAVKDDSNSSSDAGGEKKGRNKRIKRKFKKQIENVRDSSERVDNTTTGIIICEGSSSSQQANKETTGEECENEFEEEDEDDEEEEEDEVDADGDGDGDGDEDEDEEVPCEEVNKEPYTGEFSEEDCVKFSLLNRKTNVDGEEEKSLPLTSRTTSSSTATATASTSLGATTATTAGENSSFTYGSSGEQRTTRLASIVTASSSTSPVPSKSSVITTMSSPLKVSSVSTATTVVSPSPCVKRKANHASSSSKKLTKCKPTSSLSATGSHFVVTDDDDDDEQGGSSGKVKGDIKKKKKKKKKSTKKKEGKHLKGKKVISSSLLRSSLSKNGSGSKVSQVISNRESIEAKRERKAAKTLAIITGAFVVCWLPFFVQALVLPICGDYCYLPQVVQQTFQWLGYINSLINPIIYTIFSLEFRNAFKKLGNSILGRPAGFNYRHRPTAV